MDATQLRLNALQLAATIGQQAAAQATPGTPEDATTTVTRAEVFYTFLAQGLTPPEA